MGVVSGSESHDAAPQESTPCATDINEWRATHLLNEKLPFFSAKRRLTSVQLGGVFFAVCAVLILIFYSARLSVLIAFCSIFFATFCLITTSLRMLLFALSLKASKTCPEDMAYLLRPRDLPIITILIPLYDDCLLYTSPSPRDS